MAYTFLQLTNLALREVNEIPMSEQQFANARGLQQFAKESANRAFFDVTNTSTKWPWLQKATAGTPRTEIRKITKGVQWYDTKEIPSSGRLTIDWNTFLLTDKDLDVNDPLVEATEVSMLDYMTYDAWIRERREQDFHSKNQTIPTAVIRHSTEQFGFTPVPDKDYWVEFNVSDEVTRFTDATQEIPVPEEFITVFVARIKYYLWLFRENHEQANFSLGEYRESLADMKRTLLSNKQERMRAI
tara:strand:+ start:2455 stop:3183 length:729 start_codon:yes stop_codon:yes gene_type:complete